MLRMFSRVFPRNRISVSFVRRYCSEGGVEEVQQRKERSVNSVQLLGRVGRDAELRGTDEHPVVIFSLATNVSYRRSDGDMFNKTNWHRISVFRPGLRENVAANLRKGDRVFVNGQLEYHEYKDINERNIKITSILANDIINLTKKYLTDDDDID